MKTKEEYANKDRVETHKIICNELNEIYKNKNQNYGNSYAKTRRVMGRKAFLVRMMDKMHRLENMILNKDPDLVGESIEDTILDMANYCIMERVESVFTKNQDYIEEEG